jgi:hypothetical protein
MCSTAALHVACDNRKPFLFAFTHLAAVPRLSSKMESTSTVASPARSLGARISSLFKRAPPASRTAVSEMEMHFVSSSQPCHRPTASDSSKLSVATDSSERREFEL